MQDSGIANPLGIEALKPFLDLFERLVFWLYFPLLFTSAASLVVRFRRSGSVERQQIKWLGLAALVIPVWFLTNKPVQAAVPNLFLILDAVVVFALIPVAAGIAILRYRLYDIDVIINRTLVYGALTASLALVYVGSVAGLQRLLSPVVGEGNQLAVVASTLLIAALFGPLRRRVQGFIDRRFYRRKYDAGRVVADFSERLRDETDLKALSDDLASVVGEALQPAHVSVWLRAPEREASR